MRTFVLRFFLKGIIFIAFSIFTFQSYASYTRVISLVPGLTNYMYELGIQKNLIGCTSYCNAKGIPVVATTIHPNLEQIAALKPQLILVSSLIPVKDITILKKMGFQVKEFCTPKNYIELCKQYVQFATLFNKQELAKQQLQVITSQLNKIQTEFSKNKQKPKMFMQIGVDPIFTVLPNTFMDDYIRIMGGVNIAQNLKAGTVTREFVLKSRPNYIFIVTMGIVAQQEKKEWAKFTQIPAAQNKKIFYIPSDIACQATPVNFLKTIQIMRTQILGSK